MRELTAQGVEFSGGVTEQRWGLITTMQLPGGGQLGLYEPRHASPLLPAPIAGGPIAWNTCVERDPV